MKKSLEYLYTIIKKLNMIKAYMNSIFSATIISVMFRKKFANNNRYYKIFHRFVYS